VVGVSLGNAVTIIPVAEICERRDCDERAAVAMVVTGSAGTDGVGAYCTEHAKQLENEPTHTTVGEVKQ
jgi:hypothetical protein